MTLSESVLNENYAALLESLSTDFPWTRKQLLEASDKEFDLKPLGVINKTYFIEINGRKYGYVVAPHLSDTIEQVVKRFNDMLKTNNRGQALAYLRSATKVVSGSVKGISPLMR